MGGKKLVAIPIDDSDSASSSTDSPRPSNRSGRNSGTSKKTVPKSKSRASSSMLLQDLDARYAKLERMLEQSMHSKRSPDSLDASSSGSEDEAPPQRKKKDKQPIEPQEDVLEKKIIDILGKYSKPAPATKRPRVARKPAVKSRPPKVNHVDDTPSEVKSVEQTQMNQQIDEPSDEEHQPAPPPQPAPVRQQSWQHQPSADARYYKMIFSGY